MLIHIGGKCCASYCRIYAGTWKNIDLMDSGNDFRNMKPEFNIW